jgi:hypothetical protein
VNREFLVSTGPNFGVSSTLFFKFRSDGPNIMCESTTGGGSVYARGGADIGRWMGSVALKWRHAADFAGD